jgi:hypothetical protein
MVDVGYHDARPFRREQRCSRATDAGRSAGDDRDAIGQGGHDATA